jgi:hypothetical protein
MTMFIIDRGGLGISLLLLRGVAVQRSWKATGYRRCLALQHDLGHKLSVKFTVENNIPVFTCNGTSKAYASKFPNKSSDRRVGDRADAR